MIAERIQQLGGKPDFNPKSLLERSVSQYVEGETLAEMIREDLIAERIVIEVYQEMIRYFGSNDPTTRVMIEHILKDEEEHASDLADLLYIVDPQTGKTEGEDPGANPLNRQRGRGQLPGGNGHARVESDGRNKEQGVQNPSRRSVPAGDRPGSRRQQNGGETLAPDFYSTSDVDEELKRKKAGKAASRGALLDKRQESRHAGPPAAPEFSAGPRRESKAEKNWKLAGSNRKRKSA
jgi:ferritin-like protein